MREASGLEDGRDGFSMNPSRYRSVRHFIPLLPVPVAVRNCTLASRFAISVFAKEEVLLCELGGFTLWWKGPLLATRLTLEHCGSTLFKLHPRDHPAYAAAECHQVCRMLWIDVSLKPTPSTVSVGGGQSEVENSSCRLFASRDVALLICRELDQRSLGRMAQCSRAFKAVVETARTCATAYSAMTN